MLVRPVPAVDIAQRRHPRCVTQKACFDSRGDLVADFGEQGVLIPEYNGRIYQQLHLAQTPAGLVSVGGVAAEHDSNISEGMMFGFTPTGQPDTAFNQGKPVVMTFKDIPTFLCNHVTSQPDGKIVVSGFRAGGNTRPQGLLGRYHAEGTPDNDFALEGWTKTGDFILATSPESIVLTRHGRIILAGNTGNGGALAAFLS